ncbi:MAG: hypothetical protein GX297_06230 [Treponema sp.]|jgi:hypothetical protein|nr:hypothetical protein [Treponema sp.]
MNKNQWKTFTNFRQSFKDQVEKWQKELERANAFSLLKELQKKSQKAGNTPDYNIETPIVYNSALDKITEEDQIKLIIVGDNPGKNEQLSKNRAYLVGQAGKLGEKFFIDSPELNIDFRKNAIILNKTPVHSPKTKDLLYIISSAQKELNGNSIYNIINESQIYMAENTAKLHRSLYEQSETEEEKPQLWLVGYGELKKAGIFEPYKTAISNIYKQYSNHDTNFLDSFLVFQHFSMNRFSIDLKSFCKTQSDLSVKKALARLGKIHRLKIFNF